MTNTRSVNYAIDPERDWDKVRLRNARDRLPPKSKGLNKKINEFEAAMASDKTHENVSKKKQDRKENPVQTANMSELNEKGEFYEDVTNKGDDRSSHTKEDDLDTAHGYVELEVPTELSRLSDFGLMGGHHNEPAVSTAINHQPRIDFQHYQEIIERISVYHTLPNDPNEVKIKFKDKTLDGAQVVILKKGDRIQIRWQTTSESIYRLLTKQRVQLQQHVYGHLGIKSEVSIDLKKS
jgi:hypothetical protein